MTVRMYKIIFQLEVNTVDHLYILLELKKQAILLLVVISFCCLMCLKCKRNI